MSENPCRNLKMERFRWLPGEQPRSNYRFQLVNNPFSAKFYRTFEITSVCQEFHQVNCKGR